MPLKKMEQEKNGRIDHYLVGLLPQFSRGRIQALLASGKIKVNGVKVKPSYNLHVGDVVDVPDNLEELEARLSGEELTLPVLYEDKALMVLNKSAGVVVHPSDSGKNLEGSVANQLSSVVDGDAKDLRFGIVHRLDKDTSGCLIVAKNLPAMEDLKAQFRDRNVKKHYLALVNGFMEHEEGIIKAPIRRSSSNGKKMVIARGLEGREAVTRYKVVEAFELGGKRLSLLDIDLLTGRTHQIRVHFASLGHFVLGDSLYGNKSISKFVEKKFGLKRQFLHAYSISFKSPANQKQLEVKAPLAKDLELVLDKIKLSS